MQREKGTPLMQNDVWRAGEARRGGRREVVGAVGWMRSGGSRRRPRKRISTIRDKRKKAREEGRRPKLLPLLLASRRQTPRAILPLLTRCSNKVIPIENANYMSEITRKEA